MRRMRQLLDLDSVRTGAPSPVPTPSGTLPRGQRQLDINPAEFLKYKLDKPTGLVGGTSMTGKYLEQALLMEKKYNLYFSIRLHRFSSKNSH